MKDIDTVMKIVDKSEAEYLDKNTNVSVLSEISDNKFVIKYKGKISDSIRKLYKKDPLVSVKNQMINYSKTDLIKSGLNKKINIPSAVHIAAAISSYARIIINEYKNIPGNPCIMSDTDSAVLPCPLPDHLVGKELGQMKLECIIKKGIFIKKKFYYILTSDNQEIIKSSGIDSSKLDYNSFVRLLKGETITIDRTTFNLDWKELSINVVSSKIKIQGLQGGIKTIDNLNEIKSISSPIEINKNLESKNKYNNKLKDNFTYFELLFLFIFLSSYFIIFGFFLYKIY